MAHISQEDACKIFQTATTVDKLRDLIKEQSHLWWDEDSTLYTLDKCIENDGTSFSTVLLSDNGPFILNFSLQENGIKLEN